jgi:hypothetical protein
MFVSVKKIAYLTISAFVLLTSCTYNSEEELYPSSNCETVNMSLSSDITPILDNYSCIGCHDDLSTNGVDLNGYDDLKIWVNNGKLLGSMKHDGTASEMPKGGDKMNQCDIDKVTAWIEQGALNN